MSAHQAYASSKIKYELQRDATSITPLGISFSSLINTYSKSNSLFSIKKERKNVGEEEKRE